MPPRTRSRVIDAHLYESAGENAEGVRQPESSDGTSGVEVHLSEALCGVKKLQAELQSLRSRNAALERRVEDLEQAEDVSVQPRRGKKGGPTVPKLQGELKRLKVQLRELEKSQRKDRRTIQKLREREVKKDVAELEDDEEFMVGDSSYRMRKLLRRFHDTILASSIEEKEECPICLDALELDRCVSLHCEHTFCKSCISRISPGEEVLNCPQCRTLCPRDDIEIVQYTASQQWDDLLEVAKEWAKIDVRRQEDTSEEEGEQEFIDDDPPDDDASPTRSAFVNPLATSPEPEEPEAEHSPPPNGPSEVPPPATPSAKKRHIAFSSESSPLSSSSSGGKEWPSSSVLPAAPVTPMKSSELPAPSQTEPVAGPSRLPDGAAPTTPPRNGPASYAQSPAKDKRKRLEDLAIARKRKRQ